MANPTFRNRLGESVEIPEIAATQAKNNSETLDALSTKLEGLLERMQSPAARKGMEAAFNATPEALGRAATKAAKRRR